jgi:carbamoyltransferase
MRIPGISCYYLDSAVALVNDEEIEFAIQEERLSRRKHDARFPALAVGRALEWARLRINDVDRVVFYENSALKLNRLWDQVIGYWPRSRHLYDEELSRFIHHKIPIAEQIRKHLGYHGAIENTEHHRSHAASAFFTSPFEGAVVVTLDGVGDYETATVHLGESTPD